MKIIEKYDPTIIGFQEVLYDQFLFCTEQLQNTYSFYGVGRDDGATAGEFNPIFIKKEEISLINSGVFWLSDTPHKPSKTWEGCCYRICTWVEIGLQNTSLPNLLIANTHFDDTITATRVKSIAILRNKLRVSNKPLILMGDFNFTREDLEYDLILKELQLKDCFLEGYKSEKVRKVVTYHGYTGIKLVDESPRFIDYIFTTTQQGLQIGEAEIIYLNEGGEKLAFPSDHWPILVTFILD